MADLFIFLFEHIAPQIKREDIFINSGMWHRFLKKRGTDEMKMKEKKENLQELLESWMCIIWWSELGGGGYLENYLVLGLYKPWNLRPFSRLFCAYNSVFFISRDVHIDEGINHNYLLSKK